MLRPLYPLRKNPWYPLDRRLGGLQSQSGRGGEEESSQPLTGIEPPIIQFVAQRYSSVSIFEFQTEIRTWLLTNKCHTRHPCAYTLGQMVRLWLNFEQPAGNYSHCVLSHPFTWPVDILSFRYLSFRGAHSKHFLQLYLLEGRLLVDTIITRFLWWNKSNVEPKMH
jgi:hypothetical protein